MGLMKKIMQGVDAVTPDAITDPLLDVGREAWDAIDSPVGGALNTVFQIADTPRQMMTGVIGSANYYTADLRNKIGITSDNDLEEIRKAYREGGGRGVWEDAIVDDMEWWQRGLLDIAVDPLTFAGGAASTLGRAGKIMDAAGNTSGIHRNLLKGAEKTARTLNAPDRHIDKAVGKAVGWAGDRKSVQKVGSTGFMKTARKKVAEQLEYSDHVKAKLKTDQVGDLVQMMLAGKRQKENMVGALNASHAVPAILDSALVDTAKRNMVNIDPMDPANRAMERPIRKQTSDRLGLSLEDKSVQMWGTRNAPRLKERLFNKRVAEEGIDKNTLDYRVPRSASGKDLLDIDPIAQPAAAAVAPVVPTRVREGTQPAERPDGPFEDIYDDDTINSVRSWSPRKWSSVSTKVAKTIDDAMKDPEFYGGSWKLDKAGNMVELAEDSTARRGYPVAIVSAGENGVLTGGPEAIAEIKKAMKMYRPLLEDKDMFFGSYRMNNGEGYSFDINIHAKSIDEADEIAAAANQESWYDPIVGDSIRPYEGAHDSRSPFNGDIEKARKFKAAIDESRATGRPLQSVISKNELSFLSGNDPLATRAGVHAESIKDDAPKPAAEEISFLSGFDPLSRDPFTPPQRPTVPTPEPAAVADTPTAVADAPEPLPLDAPPLKTKDIHEELKFNTADQIRQLRERKLIAAQTANGSLDRSRTLKDLEDTEWTTMASKVDQDIDGFVKTADTESRVFDLDPEDGFVEIMEPRGFRVTMTKVGNFKVDESAGQIAEAVKNYRRVLQEPDVYMGVDIKPDGTYDLTINIDALTRDEAQVIGALTSATHFVDPEDSRNLFKSEVYHGRKDGVSDFKSVSDVEDLLEAVENARLGDGTIIDNIKSGYGQQLANDASFAPEPVGPQLNKPAAPASMVPPFADKNFRQNFEDRGAFTKRSLKELNENVRGVGVKRAGSDYVEGMRRPPSDIEIRKADGYFLEDDIAPETNLRETYGLDQEQYDGLFSVEMADGTTIGDYALHALNTFEKDKALFAKAGVTWGSDEIQLGVKEVLPRFDAAIKQNLTEAEQKLLKKRVRNWDKLGLYPEAPDIDGAVKVTKGKMLDEMKLKPEEHGRMARMRSIWSAVTLTSPRYVIGNLTTNVLDSMIAGHWRFDAYPDFWRLVKAEMARGEISDFMPGSKTAEYMQDTWGIGSDYTIHNRTQRNLTGANIRGDSEVRKLARQLHIEKTGIATLIDGTQAMAQALDTVARASMAMDVMESVRWREMPNLLGKLEGIIQKSGVDMMGREIIPKMDPAYIYSYYRNLGVPDGLAQRAEREVAQVRNMARKEAYKEVERVALSYRRTKLDDKIATFVPFHYWASRKFKWYAEEAYRNPVLLANYGRAIEGLERSADDPGLNARQKGFLKLFGGPTGFTLLMNPDAMLGVIRASQMHETYTPDGQTELGGVLSWMQRHSIQLFPWIQGAANMIGMQGDTFEPDMIGIRHRAIIGSVVNFARGEGWLGESNRNPGANPYADLNLQAREKVSSWVSSFTPDWLSQPVKARDKSIMEASLETTIESRIIAENPDLTNAELVALMNDPDSEEYRSAFQDAARAGVIGQGLSFTVPISFKARENTKDQRSAAYTEVKKAAEEAGIQPHEFTEKDADSEFRAAYKNQTGKEFDLKDFQKGRFQKELIDAANPTARSFLLYDQEYRSIGEGKAGKLSKEYFALKEGTDPRTMYLPADQRDDYAKSWAERSGAMDVMKEMWDLQKAYKQTHPMFGAWKEWESQMYQLKAMSGNTLAEYRRVVSAQNPAAAAYFRSQERYLEDAGIALEDMGAEMDKRTVSANAWFAINGMAREKSDPSGNIGAGDPMFGQLSPHIKTAYDEPVLAPTSGNDAYWTEALKNRVR